MSATEGESPTSNIVVYGIVSLRAFRVHWALQELGLAYRTERIESRTGQTLTPSYTRLNPRQKIPCLQDGDFVVTESAAIVTYLGEKYRRPHVDLVPQDLIMRTRYNEWLSLITMELDATSLYVIRRHEGLPDIYGAAPDVAASCREYYLKQLTACTPVFEDGRQFLLGTRLCGADIMMMTCLDWGIRYGLSLPSQFMDYRARLAQRPAYAAAMQANNPGGV